MNTRHILEERRDLALAHLDDVDWEVKSVECDDYGDPYWKWHVEFYLHGEPVTDDWFHGEPDDVRLYNYLLDGVKDGFLGDRIADILTQEKNQKGEIC